MIFVYFFTTLVILCCAFCYFLFSKIIEMIAVKLFKMKIRNSIFLGYFVQLVLLIVSWLISFEFSVFWTQIFGLVSAILFSYRKMVPQNLKKKYLKYGISLSVSLFLLAINPMAQSLLEKFNTLQ